MKKQDVTFTPENISVLFKFGEQLREICENLSKGNAVTAMASEAIESSIQTGVEFTGNTVLEAVNVIYDYIHTANGLSTELYKKYQEMYSKKRNLCCGDGEVA